MFTSIHSTYRLQTGYKPRVLIFSLSDKAPVDVPVAVIPEHAFGVHSLAFSPDSQFLASLGTVNDGFLYIWKIDDRTGAASLVASNKCTNIVKRMTWVGRSLVTVGIRFVKIWRPDDLTPSASQIGDLKYGLSSPGHKPLAGRNCLLGDLLEVTFTSAVSVSSTKAVLCTDSGDICLLDDSDKTQRVSKLFKLDSCITAACVGSSGEVYVCDTNGKVRAFTVGENVTVFPDLEESATDSTTVRQSNFHTLAIGGLAEVIVTVDSARNIQLRSKPTIEDEDGSQPAVLRQLPAHEDAVLGVRALVQPNDLKADFLTWSAGGTIVFWGSTCQPSATVQIPLEQANDPYNAVNELRAVAILEEGLVVTGDRYGVLRVTDAHTKEQVFVIRAHSGDVTDVALHKRGNRTLVASSSRDRMVQVFEWKKRQLGLLQTLDEHAGAVTGLLFAKNGMQLLSCSSDRSIVVREAIDRGGEDLLLYVIIRTIALKSAPTSMRLALYEDTLLVSTTDKCVQLIDVRSGRATGTFKAADSEGGDPVIMSSLAHVPSAASSPIIAGVSSSDKSVRLYAEDGTLLARDWGHTEGVTDIAIIRSQTENNESLRLVTVAADGTVFIWDTASSRPGSSENKFLDPAFAAANLPGSLGPPLRKVISMTEIARFQRSQSVDEGEPVSPTNARAPSLRKKISRLSMSKTPRLEPSPVPGRRGSLASSLADSRAPAGLRQRSPSPPSPKRVQQMHSSSRRGSMITSPLSKNVAASNGVSSSAADDTHAHASTGQLCRTLRAYRNNLNPGIDTLSASAIQELEKELKLTLQLVRGKGRSPDVKDAPSGSDAEPASPTTRLSINTKKKENAKPNACISSPTKSPVKALARTDPVKHRKSLSTPSAGVTQERRNSKDVIAGAETMR